MQFTAHRFFRILFPTVSEVERSAPTEAKSLLCLRREHFEEISREFFHNCAGRSDLPTYPRPIHHSKFFIRRASDPQENTTAGWVYLGSHNFSKAALGTQTTQGLVLTNLELGVLLVTTSREKIDEWAYQRFPCIFNGPRYNSTDAPFVQN
eukprot:TRINITY_DN4107_c0_g1_i3.p1 TRINITY_DN4107_c0_g1~~TRINITY_DN4107_c0_g1_i3.p1  ORF type:complete len:151 (-),score=15.32 TRINITY_DN4107_c0_g1_i3:18-470(-)